MGGLGPCFDPALGKSNILKFHEGSIVKLQIFDNLGPGIDQALAGALLPFGHVYQVHIETLAEHTHLTHGRRPRRGREGHQKDRQLAILALLQDIWVPLQLSKRFYVVLEAFYDHIGAQSPEQHSPKV